MNLKNILLFFLVLIGVSTFGQDFTNVAYGGVFVSGHSSFFKNYSLVKAEINQLIRNELYLLNEKKKLPFNLIFDADIEARKTEIENDYVLAVVINRDDIETEEYVFENETLYKNFVNVGISFIIYRNYMDYHGIMQNKIIYSIPFTGYSINLKGRKLLESEITKILSDTIGELIKRFAGNNLKSINLDKIAGKISKLKDGQLKIDKGFSHGLIQGQNIKIYNNNVFSHKLRIKEVYKDYSILELDKSEYSQNFTYSTYNIKYSSEETYQIVGFDITSKKCASMFKIEEIGPVISQWFSDGLSNKVGKIVFPPKIGGKWIVDSTKNSYQVLVKDDIEYKFSVPEAKNQIILAITGLTSKVISKNNINRIELFKVWLNAENKSKNYAMELDFYEEKKIVNDMQNFQQRSIFFNLFYEFINSSIEGFKL